MGWGLGVGGWGLGVGGWGLGVGVAPGPRARVWRLKGAHPPVPPSFLLCLPSPPTREMSRGNCASAVRGRASTPLLPAAAPTASERTLHVHCRFGTLGP